MKTLLCALMCLPMILQAQTGISFDQQSSWEQIKQRAKQENKYIFVDCYTTWCAPCKFMTDSVFTRPDVGDYVNERFISVQVQMDSTKNDNEQIKRWYSDAHSLMSNYNVHAFPTYLFFSPEGRALHKSVGVQQPRKFIQTAADAAQPARQYFTLLAQYEKGQVKYPLLPSFARLAEANGDQTLANQIAVDYVGNYLEKLSLQELAAKEHLVFASEFPELIHTDSKFFDLYFNFSARVDSVLGRPGYARSMVDYIISREEINPALRTAQKNNIEPRWDTIVGFLKGKYGKLLADRLVLGAKAGWYKHKKDWANYSNSLVAKMKREDLKSLPKNMSSILMLNNNAWDIFLHSNNKRHLKEALHWINIAIPMDTINPSGLLDTKANILYKLGRVTEAIVVLESAIRYEPQSEPLKETLQKMEAGKPTWEKL